MANLEYKNTNTHFADKCPYFDTYDKAIVFPVVMYECEKPPRRLSGEEAMLSILENTLESPLDCKEIKLVNPKGN